MYGTPFVQILLLSLISQKLVALVGLDDALSKGVEYKDQFVDKIDEVDYHDIIFDMLKTSPPKMTFISNSNTELQPAVIENGQRSFSRQGDENEAVFATWLTAKRKAQREKHRNLFVSNSSAEFAASNRSDLTIDSLVNITERLSGDLSSSFSLDSIYSTVEKHEKTIDQLERRLLASLNSSGDMDAVDMELCRMKVLLSSSSSERDCRRCHFTDWRTCDQLKRLSGERAIIGEVRRRETNVRREIENRLRLENGAVLAEWAYFQPSIFIDFVNATSFNSSESYHIDGIEMWNDWGYEELPQKLFAANDSSNSSDQLLPLGLLTSENGEDRLRAIWLLGLPPHAAMIEMLTETNGEAWKSDTFHDIIRAMPNLELVVRAIAESFSRNYQPRGTTQTGGGNKNEAGADLPDRGDPDKLPKWLEVLGDHAEEVGEHIHETILQPFMSESFDYLSEHAIALITSGIASAMADSDSTLADIATSFLPPSLPSSRINPSKVVDRAAKVVDNTIDGVKRRLRGKVLRSASRLRLPRRN